MYIYIGMKVQSTYTDMYVNENVCQLVYVYLKCELPPSLPSLALPILLHSLPSF